MLAVAVVNLHYVVEGCVEEGKLAKHHCGGDMARKSDKVWLRWGGAELGLCWPQARRRDIRGVAGAGLGGQRLGGLSVARLVG